MFFHRRTPSAAAPSRRPAALTLAAALMLAVTVSVLKPTPAAASSEWLMAEQRFADLLNQERSDRGLPTMRVSLQMVRIARDWSQQMAADSRLWHRPDVPAQVFGPWKRLGENVGHTGYSSRESLSTAVDRLHRAFMESPPHRANVLGDFNQVGIGVLVGSDGHLWATFNFLQGQIGQFPLFADIAANAHETSTEQAWVGDLARGCSFHRYCPGEHVSRAQMATFIARAVGLKPTTSNRFRDLDPRSVHTGYVNSLVHAGIANGCEADRYCPDRPVDRAQMATFLARALQLAPENEPQFVDVPPSSSHFGSVNAVAKQGITAGCDRSQVRYCPSGAVRRDQMASFLTRAFDAPVSFWQVPEESGDAPAHSSDTSTEIGEPVTYERSDEP